MWVGGSLEQWDKKDGEASVWWLAGGAGGRANPEKKMAGGNEP